MNVYGQTLMALRLGSDEGVKFPHFKSVTKLQTLEM